MSLTRTLTIEPTEPTPAKPPDGPASLIGTQSRVTWITERCAQISYLCPMGSHKTSVLLVDDHELVRQGLRRVLDGRYDICGEAANGQEAVEKCIALKPDVVLLDISMPVLNGLHAARQIRAAVPTTKILLLSMHDSAQLEREAKASGADTFLTKTAPARQLLSVIEQLVRATKQNGDADQSGDDLITEEFSH